MAINQYNQPTFNPREHLINIKNGKGTSEYLEVKWRLVWFRQECPQGTIHTEIVHLDLDKDIEVEAFAWNAEKRRSEKTTKTAKGVAIFRATIHDGKGGSATGTKQENAASFPDYIEKAESGAIGRALAALGYGTQFAPEFNEENRIVDAPVNRGDEPASQEETKEVPAESSVAPAPSAQASQTKSQNNPPSQREIVKMISDLQLKKGNGMPYSLGEILNYFYGRDVSQMLEREWTYAECNYVHQKTLEKAAAIEAKKKAA